MTLIQTIVCKCLTECYTAIKAYLNSMDPYILPDQSLRLFIILASYIV